MYYTGGVDHEINCDRDERKNTDTTGRSPLRLTKIPLARIEMSVDVRKYQVNFEGAIPIRVERESPVAHSVRDDKGK